MKTLRTQIFVWRVKLKRKKIKDQIEKKKHKINLE